MPYKKDKTGKESYLAREEYIPAHIPKRHQCALSGTIDPGESPKETARRELQEESGFIVSEDDLAYLGKTFLSKGSGTEIFYFCVDVTDKPWEEPSGDGSKFEKMAKTIWISPEDCLYVPDASFITAFAFYTLK